MLISDYFAWSTCGGDGFNHVTVDIYPAPTNAMVTVSLGSTGYINPEEAAAGILEYSVRDDQGQDILTQFADPNNLANIPFGSLPIATAKDNLSHVTMLIMTYDQWTSALLTVFGTDFGQSSKP